MKNERAQGQFELKMENEKAVKLDLPYEFVERKDIAEIKPTISNKNRIASKTEKKKLPYEFLLMSETDQFTGIGSATDKNEEIVLSKPYEILEDNNSEIKKHIILEKNLLNGNRDSNKKIQLTSGTYNFINMRFPFDADIVEGLKRLENLVNPNNGKIVSINGTFSIDTSTMLLKYTENERSSMTLINGIPILIESQKILKSDSKTISESKTRFKFVIMSHTSCKVYTIESDQMLDPLWLSKLITSDFIISNKNNVNSLLKEFLLLQKVLLQDIEKYEHLGWRKIQGKNVYLVENEAIGFDNSKIKSSITGFRIDFDKRILPSEALSSIYDLYSISENKKLTSVSINFMMLALMRQLFVDAGHTPQISLYIVGQTNSFKTSFVQGTLNLFNMSTDINNPMITLKSTAASIEPELELRKDSILCLDDFHPSVDKREHGRMQAVTETLIRLVGDSHGKMRSSSNMQRQKTYSPKCLIVLTGEQLISGASNLSRLISVEIKRNEIDGDKLSDFKKNAIIYSTHLYHFIRFLSTNYNSIVNFIYTNFDNFRKKYSCEQTGRATDAMVFFDIVTQTLSNYFKSIGHEDKGFSTSLLENSIEAVRLHNFTTNNIDPLEMFRAALSEGLYSKKIEIIDIRSESTKPRSKFYCYIDDHYIYFYGDMLMKYLIVYYNELGIHFPLDKNNLIRQLADKDWIHHSTEFHNGIPKPVRTFKTTLPYKISEQIRPKMVWIKKEVIFNSKS